MPSVTQAHDSARTVDINNYLTVENCIITSAGVFDYTGKEIPNCEQLGLDENRIYKVLRPAEEIKKSKDTFANMPLLNEHLVVYSDEFPKDNTIGTLGSSLAFDGEHLTVDKTTFWDKNAVDELNEGKKGLSAGYRYTPVLESGTYKGQRYDIKMTDLYANHVAHVDNPRNKPSVVLDGTNNSKGNKNMSKTIAQDAANAEGSLSDKIIDIFQSDMDDAEKRKKALALLGKGAEDNEPDDDKKDDKKDKPAEDNEPDDKESKKDKDMAKDSVMGMDSIINLAKIEAKKEIAEYATALSICEPLLGKVNHMALDSAEKLYNSALKHNGVAFDGLNYESKKALVGALQLIKPKNQTAIIAKDSVNAVDKKSIYAKRGL